MTRYKPITNFFLSYLIVFTHFLFRMYTEFVFAWNAFFFAFTNRWNNIWRTSEIDEARIVDRSTSKFLNNYRCVYGLVQKTWQVCPELWNANICILKVTCKCLSYKEMIVASDGNNCFQLARLFSNLNSLILAR